MSQQGIIQAIPFDRRVGWTVWCHFSDFQKAPYVCVVNPKKVVDAEVHLCHFSEIQKAPYVRVAIPKKVADAGVNTDHQMLCSEGYQGKTTQGKMSALE
jgi:hypothetical protein